MARRKRARGEGSVFYSEAKKVWIGRAIVGTKEDGSPRYREVTARTQGECLRKKAAAVEEAKEEREEKEREKAQGGRQSLGDYLAHWLANVAPGLVAGSTLANYRYTASQYVLPTLEGVPLCELSARHVEELAGGLLRQGLAPSTANRARCVLSVALEHAVRTGLLPASPLPLVPRSRVPEAVVRPYSVEESRLLLAAALPYRQALCITLAFATGARKGEILALGWEHYDQPGRCLKIERNLYRVGDQCFLKEPKSRRGKRTIELPDFAITALEQEKDRARSLGLLSFPLLSTSSGSWVCGNNITRLWKACQRQAGVPHRRFHAIRHTHASQLLAAGVPITEVARRLGDKPETILAVYAHHLPTSRDVPRLLDDAYGVGRAEGGSTVETRTKGGELS